MMEALPQYINDQEQRECRRMDALRAQELRLELEESETATGPWRQRIAEECASARVTAETETLGQAQRLLTHCLPKLWPP